MRLARFSQRAGTYLLLPREIAHRGQLASLPPLSVVQEFAKRMITSTVCAEHSFVAGGRWKEPWWLWQGGGVQ